MSPPLDIPKAELPDFLQDADSALRSIRVDSQESALRLLNAVKDDAASAQSVLALKTKVGFSGDHVERVLLWRAAQQSLPRVASLPVDPSIREALDKELRQLHALPVSMAAGGYHFNRAAKLATLRRFPAGPLEWEVSGIPRSWFLKAAFPANLRLLAFVTTRLGGWAPCMFVHVAPAPRNRALSVPKQVLRSYCRMARSLQFQPRVRGLAAHAWFHDPAAVKDHPHLEVLSQPFIENGGLIIPLGPAPPSSGVLEGNAQRKADYLAGKVQYKYGLAIWPRADALRWAANQTEVTD